MSQLAPPPTRPTFAATAAFPRRITVAQYHTLIDAGMLGPGDPFELLEGYLVLKMPRDPAHDFAIQALGKRLLRHLSEGWDLRTQCAVTLVDGEPEPDFAVVRGDESTYRTRHPGPADIGLVIEVSNTSLDRDRLDKTRIYARAGVPVYWVVNLVDSVVEVFTQPGTDPAGVPAYLRTDVFRPGDGVPVVLDGVSVGVVPVASLLP